MYCSATREIFRRRHLARAVQKHTPMIGRTAAPFNERTRTDIKCREFGEDLKRKTKKTAGRGRSCSLFCEDVNSKRRLAFFAMARSQKERASDDESLRLTTRALFKMA
jgi:hypothetical protein